MATNWPAAEIPYAVDLLPASASCTAHPPTPAWQGSLSLSLTTGSQRWPVLLILCLFNFLFPMPSLTWLGPYRQQLDESSHQLLSPPLANPSPQSLEHQLHNSGELPNPPAAGLSALAGPVPF